MLHYMPRNGHGSSCTSTPLSPIIKHNGIPRMNDTAAFRLWDLRFRLANGVHRCMYQTSLPVFVPSGMRDTKRRFARRDGLVVDRWATNILHAWLRSARSHGSNPGLVSRAILSHALPRGYSTISLICSLLACPARDDYSESRDCTSRKERCLACKSL